MNIRIISRNAVYLFICPKAKAFDPSINILAVKMPQIFVRISVWVPEAYVSLEEMIFGRPLVHVMRCQHDCHEELPPLLHKEQKTHCSVRSVALLQDLTAVQE